MQALICLTAYMKTNRFFLFLAGLLTVLTVQAADRFISFTQGDVLIHGSGNVVGGVPATIYVDSNDERGVLRAVRNLCADFGRVTGVDAELSTLRTQPSTFNPLHPSILVGTVGHSALIDRMVKEKRIDLSALNGKREMYVIQLVDNNLVIAGSASRQHLCMS